MNEGIRTHWRGTLDVLWLEDDPLYADIAQRLLDQGARDSHANDLRLDPVMRLATTLADALAELASSVPDIIIADLNLPDSQGSKTLLALRQAAPVVPLLVLSGNETLEPALLAALEEAEFMDKDELTPRRLWRSVCMAITRTSAHISSH